MTGQQQLEHFIEQTRRRHIADEFGQGADRCLGPGFDGKAGLGGKAHRAQHAHRIFPIAFVRVADDAHQLLAHVGQAVLEIQHAFGVRVVVQRIEGEVASLGILFAGAKHVVTQHPAVFVHRMITATGGTEGRHLDRFVAEHHMHQLEPASDQARAAKHPVYLFRMGIGGNVIVLGLEAEQQVAHRTANDIGLKARLVQALAGAACGIGQRFATDAVLLDRDDDRGCPSRRRVQSEYAPDEFLDQDDE